MTILDSRVRGNDKLWVCEWYYKQSVIPANEDS